ncbi:hypothetical protein BJX66DRAFT_344404 [Aspergillus keveii]|uniref:Rhodopsin domain-containing protein n=1 Tax=Aspergillus keveii TaxID=714993 RepID=A0ABR4FLD3_9EURO
MSSQGYRHRIHEDAFIISTSVLLGIASLAVLIRCIIRFYLQRKRFSLDDGFVLASFAFLIATSIIAYTKMMPSLYFDYTAITEVDNNMPSLSPQAQAQENGYQFHLWMIIALTTSTASIVAAKLSFLFFFKKLIDRVHGWRVYWWFATVYTVLTSTWFEAGPFIAFLAVGGKGHAVNEAEVECNTGQRVRLISILSIISFVLDIIGDILILIIPVFILRKIRIRTSQKILLSLTLCLTTVFLALNIARLAGLWRDGAVDTVWNIYWQIVVTEVGVFLAAAASFRSFFVVRNRNERPAPAVSVRGALKNHLTGRSWYRSSGDESLSLGQWDGSSVRELQGARSSTSGTMTRTASQDTDACLERGSRCENADPSLQDSAVPVSGDPPFLRVGLT